MKHAAAGAADFKPTGAVPDANAGFFGSAGHDPIATICTLIRVVCPNATSNNVASSLHRQYFSDVLRTLHQKDLQLLRDMDVRWSSTLLMVE